MPDLEGLMQVILVVANSGQLSLDCLLIETNHQAMMSLTLLAGDDAGGVNNALVVLCIVGSNFITLSSTHPAVHLAGHAATPSKHLLAVLQLLHKEPPCWQRLSVAVP
jgi:hypothetical protein